MVPGFLHRCLGSKEPAPHVPTASTIPTGLTIPRPIFLKVSTKTEVKDDKTPGESLSLAPLDEQNLLILHLEHLPLLCSYPYSTNCSSVHYYSDTRKESSSLVSENQTFYFPVSFMSYNTALMFQKSRWHNSVHSLFKVLL